MRQRYKNLKNWEMPAVKDGAVKKIKIHPSLRLAWFMANKEANHMKSNVIEPVHFLFAILKIFDRIFNEDAETIGLDIDDIRQIEEMILRGRELIWLSRDKIERLRVPVLNSLLLDEGENPDKILHRSSLTKNLFERSVGIAVKEASSSLNILHIFKGLLINPLPEISKLLSVEAGEKKADAECGENGLNI